MKWQAKPAQKVMRDFMIETPRCNVWADMGLGKTSATLTALDILWLAGSSFRPALVIAPKRVARDVWSTEAQKWDHLKHIRVSPILGTLSEREQAVKKDADVYTINYEQIPWLVEYCGSEWPFKIIVADESRRLKGFRLRHGGKRAAALSKIAKRTGRWINLTGTPAPEGVIDLWGQNWFLDFGKRLGRTFTAFKGRWFTEWDYQVRPRAGADSEIMELLADNTISLSAKDYMTGVEKPVLEPAYVDLPVSARRVYDDMEQDFFASLDEDLEVEAANSGSRFMKCLQLASGAIYTDEVGNWAEVHDAKIKALRELVDSTPGESLMVVYTFKHDLQRLIKAFPKGRVYESKQDEDDWNSGKLPMMFVHPQSAGHGLNFQDGGCVVVFFSQVSSLEYRQQVVERIGPVRQLQAGHPRPVIVYDILARQTLDELTYERAKTKASIQDAVRSYREKL